MSKLRRIATISGFCSSASATSALSEIAAVAGRFAASARASLSRELLANVRLACEIDQVQYAALV
jgi:hypothetical protein